MRICILGAGKMGTILSDTLCMQHEVAVYDRNPQQLQYMFNTRRLTSFADIHNFAPELLINAVTLKYTISCFEEVLPYLPQKCLISDIASVKTGLKEFYERSGHPYVSTHPMFGPTFATLRDLRRNHAIIISEGDHLGKVFFKDLYGSLGLNLHEYTFQGHDETIAYSLSIPFVSTMVFAACMKHQDAPGTTFTKHLETARGVLSEDDFLLSEILFNPYTPEQVEHILHQLTTLLDLIKTHDTPKMSEYFAQLRKNIM